jgi:hypothetical protein
MRFSFLILLMAIPSIGRAEGMPCWMNHDTIPTKLTQVAILKTLLLPIDLGNPEQDLNDRISHNDFRFLAIGGFSIEYPGLSNKSLLCTYGFRFIVGTSDAIESPEHNELSGKFLHYAEQYNVLLESLLNR